MLTILSRQNNLRKKLLIPVIRFHQRQILFSYVILFSLGFFFTFFLPRFGFPLFFKSFLCSFIQTFFLLLLFLQAFFLSFFFHSNFFLWMFFHLIFLSFYLCFFNVTFILFVIVLSHRLSFFLSIWNLSSTYIYIYIYVCVCRETSPHYITYTVWYTIKPNQAKPKQTFLPSFPSFFFPSVFFFFFLSDFFWILSFFYFSDFPFFY